MTIMDNNKPFKTILQTSLMLLLFWRAVTLHLTQEHLIILKNIYEASWIIIC